jgi:hypothetical protein
MYNWSVDLKELKKDKEAYTLWRLQQLINYGLAGERLNKRLVKKYWDKLYLDPDKKRYLKFLLWPKR